MITPTCFEMYSFHYLLNLFTLMYEYTAFVDDEGLTIKKVSRLVHGEGLNFWSCRFFSSVSIESYLEFVDGPSIDISDENDCSFWVPLICKKNLDQNPEEYWSCKDNSSKQWDGRVRWHHSDKASSTHRWFNAWCMGWTVELKKLLIKSFNPGSTVIWVLCFVPLAFYNVPGCYHGSIIMDWGKLCN